MRSIDADDVLAKIDALQDKRFKECGCPYDISVYEIVDIINACEMVDAVPVAWINKHLEWLDNCDNDFAQLAKVSIRGMLELWRKDGMLNEHTN